jgi:hypothetical protein
MKSRFKVGQRVRSKASQWTGTVIELIPWHDGEDTCVVEWDRESFPPLGAICPEDPIGLEPLGV